MSFWIRAGMLVLVIGPPLCGDVFHMEDGLVSLETVVVGDPGNPPDPSGHGAVSYPFKIGKYEVTNAQYVEFLNAKAKVDSKTEPPFRLYNSDMEEGMGCRIRRSGSNGNYSYSVDAEHADRPVNMVSYWDACRFVNWLHNCQGDGDTETGAYTLGGQNGLDGTKVRRNPGARWFLPSEDEWCKAAYFDPRKPGGPGYWRYPTRSDEKPRRDSFELERSRALPPLWVTICVSTVLLLGAPSTAGAGPTLAADLPGAGTAAIERASLEKLQGHPVDIAPWAYAWRA